MTKTQHDIVRQGYQALLDSLAVVDTIRFIQAPVREIIPKNAMNG